MIFREKQQIVILCLAFSMVVGFVLLRYLPLQKRIKAVEQRRTEQRLAIAEAQRRSEQLPILKEQLLKLQRTVGNYEANVPAQRDLGVFLQQIANLMDEHNLKEQQVQPGKEMKIVDSSPRGVHRTATGSGQRTADSKKLSAIPVNIQCKGKLKQIFEFYRRLQKLDRLVRIEQVKLENDSDFSGEVSSQTRVVVYYRTDNG